MVKLSIDNIIDNTECTSQQLQSTSSCLANTPAITKHGLRQKYWKHDLNNNIVPYNRETSHRHKGVYKSDWILWTQFSLALGGGLRCFQYIRLLHYFYYNSINYDYLQNVSEVRYTCDRIKVHNYNFTANINYFSTAMYDSDVGLLLQRTVSIVTLSKCRHCADNSNVVQWKSHFHSKISRKARSLLGTCKT